MTSSDVAAMIERWKNLRWEDAKNLSGRVAILDPELVMATAAMLAQLQAEREDWSQVFEAQKSVIGLMEDTLRKIKRENQHYNFGSKLVRLVNEALDKLPAPATKAAQP